MRKIYLHLALIPIALSSTVAMAETGDILVKIRPNYWIRSDESKSIITINDVDHSIEAQNSFGAEAAMDFFLTDNIVAEVTFGGTSLKQKAANGSSFATSGQLVPTATLLYYPAQTSARVHPYFGGGGSYVSLYSEKPGALLTAQGDPPPVTYAVSLGSTAAPVIQAGADISLNEKLYINFDVKYVIANYDVIISKNDNSILRESAKSKINSFVLGVGVGSKF